MGMRSLGGRPVRIESRGRRSRADSHTGPFRASAPSVLVVAADRDSLAATRAYLARFCGRVLTARSASAARRILRYERVDVVLCDLHIGNNGNGNGLRLLAYVREHLPAAARLLVTGPGDDVLQRPIFPAASAVIRRPCDMRSLRSLLEILAESLTGGGLGSAGSYRVACGRSRQPS